MKISLNISDYQLAKGVLYGWAVVIAALLLWWLIAAPGSFLSVFGIIVKAGVLGVAAGLLALVTCWAVQKLQEGKPNED